MEEAPKDQTQQSAPEEAPKTPGPTDFPDVGVFLGTTPCGTLRLQFNQPITFIDFDRNTALDLSRKFREIAMKLPVQAGRLIVPATTIPKNGQGVDA